MPEPAGLTNRITRALLLVAATALLVAAAGWWLSGREAPPERTAVEGQESATTAPEDPVAAPEPVMAPRQPGAPVRVRIPTLSVDAMVLPVLSVDDVLVPPADPLRLGWWADGAKPGSGTGSVLVTGHTVRNGRGALDDLENLAPGDRVLVRTDAEPRLVYEVTAVRTYDKGRLARVAERVFSQEVPERLVLITCEDWDGTQYLSNVVVTARPI